MSLSPNVVLVHGAFANAGCWSKLVPLLRAKRFNVVASNCPLSSLADDAVCRSKNYFHAKRPRSAGRTLLGWSNHHRSGE